MHITVKTKQTEKTKETEFAFKVSAKFVVAISSAVTTIITTIFLTM